MEMKIATLKAWSVEIAWSSLSIHPPSASALSISALQDGTLRALVSVAVCVRGHANS